MLPTTSKSGKKTNQHSGATALMTTYEEKLGVPASAMGEYRSQSRKSNEKRGSIFLPNHNYSQSGYSILLNPGHSASIRNLNFGGGIVPVIASPSVALRGMSSRSRDELISHSDVQSMLEFKRI